MAKLAGIKGFFTVINSNNFVSRHNEEKIGGYRMGSIVFLKCRYFNKAFLTLGLIKRGISFRE
jgi:hypothetical protein